MLKLCCPECFGDSYLKRITIPKNSRVRGTCSYCESIDQPLVSPADINVDFERLLDIYVADQNDKGLTLAELFKNDWALFSHAKMDNAHAKELLADILNDGERVRKLYTPLDQTQLNGLQQWSALKDELTHSNRYFPRTEINWDRLSRWIWDQLRMDRSEIPEKWFRGRIQQSDKTFLSEDMGAPPRHLASHGRANPAGIPYLYLASTIQTAVCEIRPHTGESVCVAEFKIHVDLNIADLRSPKVIPPFLTSAQSRGLMIAV